jgi:hypothetical protein
MRGLRLSNGIIIIISGQSAHTKKICILHEDFLVFFSFFFGFSQLSQIYTLENTPPPSPPPQEKKFS